MTIVTEVVIVIGEISLIILSGNAKSTYLLKEIDSEEV